MENKNPTDYAIGALVAIIYVMSASWVVYMIWNALAPELFDNRALTYWQVLGVVTMIRFTVR